MSRNSSAALAATIAVLAAVILGFLRLGTPSGERQIHQDARTVQAMRILAGQIDTLWSSSNRVLPANLGHFAASATEDPTTHAPFTYRPGPIREYDLCAKFLTGNRDTATEGQAAFWAHGKGDYCFHFDASVEAPPTPYLDSY